MPDDEGLVRTASPLSRNFLLGKKAIQKINDVKLIIFHRHPHPSKK
jgi:hypothetical protein